MHNSSDTRYLPAIRIGEVAKILRISTSTLRQYEDLGIVLPSKEASGQPMYSTEDIEWLRKLHRRKRRDCPAYVEKEAVLKFEKYFGTFLLTDIMKCDKLRNHLSSAS